MADPKQDLVRDWLRKAQHDLASARKLGAEPDAYLDTAIYHCQQAAEKSLKGFLAFHDRDPEKTHDLEFLITAAAAIDKSFSELLEAGDQLTPYATIYRYPGAAADPDVKEFRQACEAAQKVCSKVLSQLPKAVHP